KSYIVDFDFFIGIPLVFGLFGLATYQLPPNSIIQGQKILLDPCIMESHLYRYRRGIGKNVVISIVLEFSMFHESLH
ncbi:hypothetical protein, partial [Bacillus cereus]|uniref:hypothetical protein n=1 Tax=Bacillus cereus TaxID=1396 RepID=UPI003CD0D52F